MYDLTQLFQSHSLKEIEDYIKEKPYLVNQLDDHGDLPLQVAILLENEELFQILLHHKADINAKNKAGASALKRAYESRHLKMFDELLLRGAVDDSVVILAQAEFSVRFYKMLWDYGRVPKRNLPSLLLAATSGNLEDFIWLCNCKENPVKINDNSYYKMTALHMAALWGYNKIVEELLTKGALTNLPNEKNQTPLFLAVIFRRLEVIQILLKAGAEVNFLDSSGMSVLSHAAAYNYTCGPELPWTLDIFRPVIPEIAESIGTEISRLLLDAGANITGINDTAMLSVPLNANNIKMMFFPATPIILAAINGNYGAVELLLERGVDPNSTDKFGKTLLMYAVENGRKKIVELLLQKGADLFAIYQGVTAMRIAEINAQNEIIDLFLSKVLDPEKLKYYETYIAKIDMSHEITTRDFDKRDILTIFYKMIEVTPIHMNQTEFISVSAEIAYDPQNKFFIALHPKSVEALEREIIIGNLLKTKIPNRFISLGAFISNPYSENASTMTSLQLEGQFLDQLLPSFTVRKLKAFLLSVIELLVEFNTKYGFIHNNLSLKSIFVTKDGVARLLNFSQASLTGIFETEGSLLSDIFDLLDNIRKSLTLEYKYSLRELLEDNVLPDLKDQLKSVGSLSDFKKVFSEPQKYLEYLKEVDFRNEDTKYETFYYNHLFGALEQDATVEDEKNYNEMIAFCEKMLDLLIPSPRYDYEKRNYHRILNDKRDFDINNFLKLLN